MLTRAFLPLIGLAVCAFGQPTLAPATLRLGAAVSGTPASDTLVLVSSPSAGLNAPFTTSIQYWSATQGWLSISQQSGTTPAILTLVADPTNLAAGTYTATVTAAVGASHLVTSTFVTFIVAATGWTPGGIAVSPSTLTFLGTGATPQTITLADAPGVSGALGFTVFANPSNLLSITQNGSATNALLTVQPVGGIAPGTYTASITILEQTTGSAVVVPVTIYIANSGNTIALTPAQSALTFNFQLNTVVNPQQTVYVSTSSTLYTNFTVTSSDSWLQVAAQSYATPASSAASFAPGLFFVSVNPAGLAAGTYKGTLSLTAAGAIPGTIPVTLTVSSSPVFNTQPSFVSLNSVTNTLTSNLAVTASSPVFFSASVSVPWLSISPSSGVASANETDLTVTANPSGAPSGTYQGTITLTASGGSPTMTIPVQFTTASGGTTSTLQVLPSSLTFSGVTGTDPAPQFVVLQNSSGATAIPFTAAVVADSSWLKVDRLSGSTPALFKVTASSNIPGGKYSGSVVFTALPTGDQQTLAVTYNLTGRTLNVNPTIVTFTQPAVGASITPQQLQVTANAASTFQIASQPNWLSITPSSPYTTPVTLTLAVNTAGLAPGKYQDSIILSGPNSIQIPVALTIAAPAPPTVSPSTISFSYALGAPIPALPSLQVYDSNGPVPFAVTASTSSGIKWLLVTPGSGSTPASIAVQIDPTQLVPGSQSGNIAVAFQDAAGTTITVPVSVTVTGSSVQILSVVNAASWEPTSLAPGELVTLAGSGFGPATPVLGVPSIAGAYGTTLAGVTVFFDQIPSPLLAVQNNQINAVVPYELAGRTTASVQVQSGSSYSIPITLNVVGASPGIFTTASSGRAQAAALNADLTPNSVLNPAPIGSAIVLYLTGEGQTDPPGQDGRVIATDLRTPLLPVTATIGGQPATVLYAGSAPGLISGACQVNLQIPNTINPGTQAVEVQIGGVPTQRGITIEVR